jgi:mRNA interferase RelE/StbE
VSYKIFYEKNFKKQLMKFDGSIRQMIVNYIVDIIQPLDDPRKYGKYLVGDKSGLYRYKIKNYRIICQIIDEKITVVMLSVGHRKDIYKTRIFPEKKP